MGLFVFIGGFMNGNLASETEISLIEEPQAYKFQNRTFIVEPVFKKDGNETIGTILMKLMQSDSKKI